MNEQKSPSYDGMWGLTLEEFQMGLKLIIGSYEGKIHFFEQEIANLNEIINQKHDIVIF